MPSASWYRRVRVTLALVAALTVCYGYLMLQHVLAQEGGPSAETATAPAAATEATAETDAGKPATLNLLTLYLAGGFFMYPITVLSIIAVIAAIERGFALRTGRVFPEPLVQGLGQMATTAGGFDPRKAFKLCQQYPSTAANVLRALLLRVGRPLAEMEAAVNSVKDREANKLYHNVRWLNLAATTCTMLGLLGTIQGMILAFHKMSTLAEGADKAQELSAGIYIALVTTAAGLMVAIPSIMVAHFYEGRIQVMFHHIEELVESLLPQVERFEGRVRFSRTGEDEKAEAPLPRETTAPAR